jgi:predicted O-methyltransferase YrrM
VVVPGGFAAAAGERAIVEEVSVTDSSADDERAKFTRLTPELYRYVVDSCSRRDPLLDALAGETRALGGISVMQVSAEQGALLTLLARTLGARSAIEIGTFTGYSAICIARGLVAGGTLIACDISEEWTAIARRYFRRAGLDDRIELRIGPALDTLGALAAQTTFDLAFVDADKKSYHAYYEAILERLRPGGLLVIDNVLWMGQVIDPRDRSESTQAIRSLNARIAGDPRVDAVMLPVSDGITIVRKRGGDER